MKTGFVKTFDLLNYNKSKKTNPEKVISLSQKRNQPFNASKTCLIMK